MHKNNCDCCGEDNRELSRSQDIAPALTHSKNMWEDLDKCDFCENCDDEFHKVEPDPDQISKRMEDCFDEAERILKDKTSYVTSRDIERIEATAPEVAVALFNAGWCKE